MRAYSMGEKLFDLAVCPHLYLKWTMGDEVCRMAGNFNIYPEIAHSLAF